MPKGEVISKFDPLIQTANMETDVSDEFVIDDIRRSLGYLGTIFPYKGYGKDLKGRYFLDKYGFASENAGKAIAKTSHAIESNMIELCVGDGPDWGIMEFFPVEGNIYPFAKVLVPKCKNDGTLHTESSRLPFDYGIAFYIDHYLRYITRLQYMVDNKLNDDPINNFKLLLNLEYGIDSITFSQNPAVNIKSFATVLRKKELELRNTN